MIHVEKRLPLEIPNCRTFRYFVRYAPNPQVKLSCASQCWQLPLKKGQGFSDSHVGDNVGDEFLILMTESRYIFEIY